MAKRQLESELLDELPAHDQRAKQSRKDLRRINSLMAHTHLMANAWRRNNPDRWVQSIVEIGAGDGTFLLRFAKAIAAKSRPYKVTLVDRLNLADPETLAGFEKIGWQAEVVAADVFDWLKGAEVKEAAILCNLFLHHFSGEQLRQLLEGAAQHSNLFIALEPRRSLAALTCSKLLRAIGCNEVTRHDAVVSVRAGFRDKELTPLWPKRGWYIQETEAGLFSHCFSAQRFTDLIDRK